MIEKHTVSKVSASRYQRIFALMRRERITRFAGGKLSEIWVYITPIFWIALVAGAFGILGRIVPITTDPALFVASGILPYAIFRQSITSMMRCIVANRLVLVMPSVSIPEVLIATAALELFTSFITSILVFSGISIIYGSSFPNQIENVVLAIFTAWLIGVSLGCLFVSFGTISDTVTRSVPIILRPVFWVSGVFYISAELPANILEILSYNPLLHSIEFLREGYFFSYNAVISSVSYPIYFSAVCLTGASLVFRWIDINKASRHKA